MRRARRRVGDVRCTSGPRWRKTRGPTRLPRTSSRRPRRGAGRPGSPFGAATRGPGAQEHHPGQPVGDDEPAGTLIGSRRGEQEAPVRSSFGTVHGRTSSEPGRVGRGVATGTSGRRRGARPRRGQPLAHVEPVAVRQHQPRSTTSGSSLAPTGIALAPSAASPTTSKPSDSSTSRAKAPGSPCGRRR